MWDFMACCSSRAKSGLFFTESKHAREARRRVRTMQQVTAYDAPSPGFMAAHKTRNPKTLKPRTRTYSPLSLPEPQPSLAQPSQPSLLTQTAAQDFCHCVHGAGVDDERVPQLHPIPGLGQPQPHPTSPLPPGVNPD